MNNNERSWMYKRREGRYLSKNFLNGVENFIKFALTHASAERDGDKLKCPCARSKCRNFSYWSIDDIKCNLCSKGFVPDYYIWTHHGEIETTHQGEMEPVQPPAHIEFGGSSSDTYMNMVHDVVGPSFNVTDEMPTEPPNPEAQKFFDLLNAAKQSLYPGCQNHNQLSLVARLMNLKSENGISQKCYDQIIDLIKEIVPDDSNVADNFYESKKLLRGIGLPVEKIDCCRNNCMLYWKNDSERDSCKVCAQPRFKVLKHGNAKCRKSNLISYKKMYYFPITPHLQRLYASKTTSNDMRWHAEHVIEDGVMRHPSDSEAWKNFDQTHPEFAVESRNVRLGLCTDGFQPFGAFGSQYSSWPVIVTPYNLPPWLCMKEEYMFLSVLVPGPKNPKEKLDVFVQPLIDELNQLWSSGAPSLKRDKLDWWATCKIIARSTIDYIESQLPDQQSFQEDVVETLPPIQLGDDNIQLIDPLNNDPDDLVDDQENSESENVLSTENETDEDDEDESDSS
ncbi:hypothetical protein CASFOL_031659 [Castilleja foliolosa]|uniref:C2H2-type domain-containing protein n=1 Tax=Castilleja foliolosa TaxID=1961234 RepID=A0ABD3C6M0_9LAMI